MIRPGELELNQPIEVSVEAYNRVRWAKSRVIEIRGKRRALISVPYLDGVGVPLRVGTDVSVILPDDSAIWTVSGRIVGRELEPVPALSIELIGKAIRAQRREFVRIPCLLDVDIAWSDSSGGHSQRVTAVDISGGGLALRLRSGDVPSSGTDLRVSFELPPSGDRFVLKSRAVRVHGSATGGWFVGVAFGAMPTADSDRIVQYCFKKQRELIAKGVLKR